jgi:hypothetical protein
MQHMPINLQEFANADGGFREQVTAEMQHTTKALGRIAALLQAGLADPKLLMEFREAVDRVREAGWILQQGLDSAQPDATGELLFAHRARAATSLLKQLRLDLENLDPAAIAEALKMLLEASSTFLEAARPAVGACGKEQKRSHKSL